MITPGQPLDLDRLRKVVSEEMPWIAEPGQLRVLGFGFRSVAAGTASGEVLLIGKVAETAASYARIVRLAPRLGRRLPLAIPQPTSYLPASERLPGGVLCYPKIPGRPLEPADIEGPARPQIAAALARFLQAFHRFPAALAHWCDVPVVGKSAWVETVETVLPTLRHTLTPEEYTVVDIW